MWPLPPGLPAEAAAGLAPANTKGSLQPVRDMPGGGSGTAGCGSLRQRSSSSSSGCMAGEGWGGGKLLQRQEGAKSCGGRRHRQPHSQCASAAAAAACPRRHAEDSAHPPGSSGTAAHWLSIHSSPRSCWGGGSGSGEDRERRRTPVKSSVGTPSWLTAFGSGKQRDRHCRFGRQTGLCKCTALPPSSYCRRVMSAPPPCPRSSRSSTRRRRGRQGSGAARAAGGASGRGPGSRRAPTPAPSPTRRCCPPHVGKNCKGPWT